MTHTWKFDQQHSNVGFVVKHMMFSKVRGQFASWNGHLEYDPDNPTDTSVVAAIETSSVDTGVEDRDDHLRSEDFFASELHPEMRFESTNVSSDGDNLTVEGNLTIRDVTHPVILDVERLGEGVDPWGNTRIGFSATGRINRKDFGLTWNQTLETGGVLVGKDVDIEIEVQAVEQSEG